MEKRFLMKQFFIYVLVWCLASLTVSAQDVIVKKDGSTILSKVTEIGTTDVKYKKWSNIEGPLYTIAKANVLSINYENGEVETFSEEVIPSQEQSFTNAFSTQITENTTKIEIAKLESSSRTWMIVGETIGVVTLLGGIALAVTVDETFGYVIGGTGLVVGLVCAGISGTKQRAVNTIKTSHIAKHNFDLGGRRNLAVGVDLFNDIITKDQALGINLCLNF